MSPVIDPRNQPSNDQLIDEYLRRERMSSATRLLSVGALLTAGGSLGSWFVYRWSVDGGVLPRVVLAAPFALMAGVPILLWGAWQLARARRLEN